MTLPDIILKKLARDHRGRERAIRREDLLRYAHLFDANLTDRGLRNIYSKLAICVCEEGIFYPIRTQEMESFREYMKRKAIPHFERYRRVAQAHPHLVPERGEQGELFHG